MNPPQQETKILLVDDHRIMRNEPFRLKAGRILGHYGGGVFQPSRFDF